MPFQYPMGGLAYTPEFIGSSLPYLTSSNVSLGGLTEISFQNITKFVIVKNASTGSEVLALGVTRNGVIGSNKILLNAGESFTADWKLTSLWLSGSSGATVSFSVAAGLSGLDASRVPPITGSAHSSGSYQGVG